MGLGNLLLIPGLGEPKRMYEQYPFAVGYSLRRIRSKRDYSGPCITVRRSTDSEELDIGYGPDDLVDIAAIATFCGAGSGFVSRWYDPSPDGNHGEQSTAILQARIYNAGVQEVNEFGKPVARFLKPTSSALGHLLPFNPWHTASQAYVGTFVSYSIESAGNIPFVLGSTPLDRGLSILHSGGTRNARMYSVRSTSTTGTGTSPLTLSQTYIRHDSANRTRLKTCFDTSGTALIDVADANTDFNMPTKYYLGATDVVGTVISDTKISEFIAYATDQSANELAIRTSMFNFWRSA